MILISCRASKSLNRLKSKGGRETRIKIVQNIGDFTYQLTEITDDKAYKFEESNSIKVGGVNEKEDPLNQRRFIEPLYESKDKKMIYWREGSCYPSKTDHRIDNIGMLYRYRAVEISGSDSLTLYLKMYDKGDLKIPSGLKAK